MKTLGSALSATARRCPSRLAVDDGRRRLTYAELDFLSTMRALALRAKGVVPGAHVGIIAPKDASSVVAIFATLKAGGTYLPMDPKGPPERWKRLLSDAEAAAIIAPKPTLPAVAGHCAAAIPLEQMMDFEVPAEGSIAYHRLNIAEVLPSDVAYCMFTSGSMGVPKGVQIEHQSVMAFHDAVNELMELTEESRCLNTAPFHFDVSVADTLLPLACGATVFLSGEVMLPAALLREIERRRITHMCAVSSSLNLLVTSGAGLAGRDLSSLRCIMTGAEVLNVQTVQAWLRAVPGLTIINGYGPTEATCVCIAQPIRMLEPERRDPYPIGRPLRGIEVLVCDESGNAVTDGEVGELAVAGVQVMRGYWKRSQETRARTLEIDGKRFYRTGDLGYIDDEGVVHFKGRRDLEAKIRGYRVHLNEVLSTLLGQPGVGDAAVHVVEDGERGMGLAVAILTHGRPTVEVGLRLRKQLRSQLPDYMVPRYFLLTDSFDRAPSGKVNNHWTRSLVEAHIARAGAEVAVVQGIIA